AEMKPRIPGNIAKARTNRLMELSKTKKDAYVSHLIKSGTMLKTIVEQTTSTSATGLSDHYIRVYVSPSGLSVGDIVEVIPQTPLNNGVKANLYQR
ncbi:MAG: hypothetical protein K8S56_08260, partial [Candidatus Cloacimonetes bacterium]|nr:hypothetical protein [Candidatus Cloacimonadota bacterium]